MAANGLTLHPDKTRVGDSRQPGQGFEFLGYRFEAGRRLVRKKSLTALKDKVRAKTGRSRGDSLERIITDLNPLLRGWFGYFQHATPALFGVLDCFDRRRLRALLRKQEKRPGFGRCTADPALAQRFLRGSWAVHPSCGLRAGETLPMRKPTTGEPYAGEPHVRFGGRGGSPLGSPLPDPSRVGQSPNQLI